MLRRQRLNGQAYLEFIIVFPALILLMLLSLDLAEFWWGRLVVSTATFESARAVAGGQSLAQGQAIYRDLTHAGQGSLNGAGLTLRIQPDMRSVSARVNVPWTWPFGTPVLLGASPKLDLKASAFFRLEKLYLGPPDKFE